MILMEALEQQDREQKLGILRGVQKVSCPIFIILPSTPPLLVTSELQISDAGRACCVFTDQVDGQGNVSLAAI